MSDLIDRDALIDELKRLRFPCMLPSGADYLEGVQTAVRKITGVINSAPVVSRLIPCSEQMMPYGEKLLVRLTNGEFFVMQRSSNSISDGLRHLTDLSGVTHWMPLPDAYETPGKKEVQMAKVKPIRPIDAIQLHKKIMDDAEYDFSKELNLAQCLLYVENAPTLNAAPVKHGRWKKKNEEIYCTNCKKSRWSESFDLMLRRFNYCPNCGAKMDEGAK